MSVLSALKQYEITFNNVVRRFGSTSSARTVAATAVVQRDLTLAAGASATLFDKGVAGEISQLDFALLDVPSGASFELEVKTTDGSAVGAGSFPNVQRTTLRANWINEIGTGVWYRNYGALGGGAYTQFSSGTTDLIDTVVVKNVGSSSASLSFLGIQT